jgi:uncharacterized protein (UPF0333 family)
MSEKEVESIYIREEGEGDNKTITILEDAFIGPENIGTFKHTFGTPSDITESLEKNKTEESKKVSTYSGRIGYASYTCTYPDGTSSSKVTLKNVVIQYNKGMTNEKSTYAKNYIFIGIPEIYISEIKRQAKQNSGINIEPRSKNQLMSSHWWMSCNLDQISTDSVTITFMVDDEPKVIPISLYEALNELKSNLLCNMTISQSATITNDSIHKKLDLKNGQYHFAIKPTQIAILKETDIEAPSLADLEKKKKEKAENCEISVASSLVARLALSRIG